MTDFKPGELVTITIENATVATAQPGVLAINYGDTKPGQLDGYITIDTTAKGVTVERVAPAQWPPQAGDLWEDRHGARHFGISYAPDYDDKADCEGMSSDGTRVILVASGGDDSCRFSSAFYRPERVNQQSGPLTLVYRQQPRQGDADL